MSMCMWEGKAIKFVLCNLIWLPPLLSTQKSHYYNWKVIHCCYGEYIHVGTGNWLLNVLMRLLPTL